MMGMVGVVVVLPPKQEEENTMTDQVPMSSLSSSSPWEMYFHSVAVHILPFLGIRSLARVGSLHKTAQLVVMREVQRRQSVVTMTETIVADLLRQWHNMADTLSSSAVHNKNKLVSQIFVHQQNALALIDDELDWQPRYENKNMYPSLYPAAPRDPWFLAERCKFLDLRCGGLAAIRRKKYRPSPLCLLPPTFYWQQDHDKNDDNNNNNDASQPYLHRHPNEQSGNNNNDDESLSWLSQEMLGFANFLWRHDEYAEYTRAVMLRFPFLLNRQDPLQQFWQGPLFREDDPNHMILDPAIVNHVVQRLATNVQAWHAFQKVAQSFVLRVPAAQDLFHLVLELTLRETMGVIPSPHNEEEKDNPMDQDPSFLAEPEQQDHYRNDVSSEFNDLWDLEVISTVDENGDHDMDDNTILYIPEEDMEL